MDNKLQSAFFYHRSKGRPASSAIHFARGDIATGREWFVSRPSGKPLNYGWGNARGDDGGIWIERLDAAGLRLVDYADKLARLNHTGWYTSDDSVRDETLRGVVVRMPARGGASHYLPGYEDPNNPGSYRIDVSAVFLETSYEGEAARDCARAADHFAQRNAEEEREYNRAWQAGRRWEDLAADISTTRKGLLSLIVEAKAACKERRLGPAVRAAIGDKIKFGLAAINNAREQRAELLDQFGRAPGWEG